MPVPGTHDDGVVASGPGAVAVGGDIVGPVSIEVTDAEDQAEQ
jgi:hypothetical protein